MESLRVGGIVSGLDTNSIIDSMMAVAKEPINALNQQISDLTYEKSVYNEFLTSLNGLKTALLPLKLESTFKSKLVTSSVPSIANATASTNTPTGTYSLNVSQLAKPAFAGSIFTNKTLTSSSAGVTGIANNAYAYDQIEGTHNVQIFSRNPNQLVAKDEFESKNGQKYVKSKGESIDILDSNGKLTEDINKTVEFSFTFNGQTEKVSVSMNYASGTNMSVIAQDLEQKINAAIDQTFTKNGVQQIAIRSEMDENTGKFNFAFYDVSAENSIIPLGFRDNLLGLGTFDSGVETTKMVNYISSNNLVNLKTKITDTKGGLFAGAKLQIASTGLEEGRFQVYQDATANSRPATKTTFKGGTLTAAKKIEDDPAGTLNGKTAEEKILEALKSSPLENNILFDTAPTTATNGFFTINGVKIEIEDYTKITPASIIAKINGAGAGITATFDMETKTFRLENNSTGPNKITLGGSNDTSDILSILKLPVTAGGIYKMGQTEGNIDTTVAINKAGFSAPINTGVFTINGVSIYVDAAKDSVDDVIDKVNKSGAGVKMSYDQNTDKFNLIAVDGTRIKLGSSIDSSSFLQATGLNYFMNTETEVGSMGTSAIFTINGTKYERLSNEVSDAVQGMSFSISGVGSTLIKVDINTDTAVDAFAEFASKYNELVNKFNPATITKQDREKYSEPLSDENKKNMNEEEIKNYEKNYNAIRYYDLIHSSSELKRLQSTIRSQVFNTINLTDNKYRSLSSLGILTAGGGEGDITITKLGLLLDVSTDKDELTKYLKQSTKFVNYVKNDSDEVFKFFSKQTTQDYTDASGKTQTKVVAQGWSRAFDTYIVNNTTATSILYKKTSVNGTIESAIKRLQEQVEVQTKRAENYLERMWSEFSAMEQRVQEANNKASYLNQISAKQNA